MKRSIRLFLAAVLTFGALSIGATVTAPAAQACAATIYLYDNPNYHVDAGEQVPLVRCYGNDISSLSFFPFKDVSGRTGGWCGASLTSNNSWNDCVSSWKFVGGCHYGVTLWVDNYYVDLLWSAWGSRNFSGGIGYEDQLSSLKFRYRSTCPV